MRPSRTPRSRSQQSKGKRLAWPAAGRLAGILAVYAAALQATTIPRLSLNELAQGSGLIVHGRVLRQWCGWDPEHRFIWTHSELAIREVLKGRPNTTITISEPGGTVNGLTMQVPGVVQFAAGEEVVVFLHDTPLHYWRVRGWTQGKYRFTAQADLAAFKLRIRELLR
jgi:hypothetical protein